VLGRAGNRVGTDVDDTVEIEQGDVVGLPQRRVRLLQLVPLLVRLVMTVIS
jgi:hypothetical protein